MGKCSVVQLQEFKSSFIYQDMVAELDQWIEDRRQDLEDPDFQFPVENLYRLQGAIKALRDVKDSLLDVLIALAGEQERKR